MCIRDSLYGGLGGRVDHAMINLRLVSRFPETVYLHDENNFIYSLGEGIHSIGKRDYTYISFFTEDESIITLKGMKYPLTNQKLTNKDTYTTSNEILEEMGIVTVHTGKVTVIPVSYTHLDVYKRQLISQARDSLASRTYINR